MDYNDWNIPKVQGTENYKKKWSLSAFKTTAHIKTVEQVYALGKVHETYQLFNIESIKKHRKYCHNFLHIYLVQVAVKPFTKNGNFSVL